MNMKKFVAGVLACCMVGGVMPTAERISDNYAVTVSAADEWEYGTYESFTYKNYGDHIEIALYDGEEQEVVIPDEIEGLPVTVIGSDSFKGCSRITTLTIPDSVTSIESSAFYNCSGLTEIKISESMTNIESNAFSGCSKLTDIKIPDSVTHIGDNAFSSCLKLKTIEIPETLTDFGAGVFSNSAWLSMKKEESPFVIVNGVLIDGKGCTGIVNIPEGVTKINNSAFSGCEKILSVIVPEGVIDIDISAFYKCSRLTDVKLPESLENIGEAAFYGCAGITKITIPNNVKNIETKAFYGCAGLTEVVISGSIGESVFEECKALTSIEFADNVENIGIKAFYGCAGLTEITVPGSVKSIGESAFYNCKGLTSLEIADGVESIEKNAFYGCSELTEITIPESVKSIDTAAFGSCSKLVKITVLNPECDLYIDNSYTNSSSNAFGSLNSNLGTVIRGYNNSTAHAYAVKAGYSSERYFESLGEYSVPFTTAYIATTTTTTRTTMTATKIPWNTMTTTRTATKVPATGTQTQTTAGLKVTVWGDANCDGNVTIADATAIIQYLGNADEYALSEQGALNADVIDRGGGITGADANAIQAIEAGFIRQTDFPLEKAEFDNLISR